jgi:predicted  nucleic acid-binding Zn-ribbon protein
LSVSIARVKKSYRLCIGIGSKEEFASLENEIQEVQAALQALRERIVNEREEEQRIQQESAKANEELRSALQGYAQDVLGDDDEQTLTTRI